MKKITIKAFVLMFFMGTILSFSQTLNQNANWPNANWTLTGTYNASALLSDPTTTGSTFSFDDDDAGISSSDNLILTSPIIDLTAASGLGETWITVSGEYVYRLLTDVLSIEVYDADASTWTTLDIFSGNSTNTNYKSCSGTAPYTSVVLDISGYTATQLSGFQYRISYDDNGGWKWGWCLTSPNIMSATPPECISPSNLSASVLTASTAGLSWNPGATESLWDIEVVDITAGGTVTGIPTATGVSNPYVASGLTEGNDYEFYVRADCVGDGTSSWSGPFAWSQNVPPSNDECENAVDLTVNADLNCGSFTAGTTVFATASPQTDDVTGTPNNDVWFSFVASAPEHRISLLNITAVIGFSTDMGMGVYDATDGCAALTLIDDSDPNTLNLSGLMVGTTYLVRVYGWSSSSTNTAQTTFDICIGTPCQANAGTLTAIEASVVFSGGTATISATPNGDAVVPTNYDVTYVLTSGATLVIEQTSATPSFDVTSINDYTIHTLVAETTDNTDPNYLDLSVVNPGVTTGADVLDLISAGDLCADLDVAGAPISVNDGSALDFYNVQYIEETGSNPSNGSSQSLSLEVGTSVTIYAQGYEPGVTEAVGQGSGVECWIAINNENTDPATWPNSLWQVASYGSDQGNNDEYFYETSSTPIGANYVAARWRLNNAGFTYGGFNGAWDGTSNVNIELILDPLANDECANAETIVCGGQYIGDTTFANPIFPDPGFCDTSSGTAGAVWYKFTGTNSNDAGAAIGSEGDEVTLDLSLSTFDTKIRVFEGSCGALTCVAGNDDGGTGTTSLVSIPTTVGTEYYVLVHGYSSNAGEYTLDVSCVAPCFADAGTLTADATPVNLSGGIATISATPNGDSVVPTNYDVTYVLTSGPTLVIEDAGATPSFDVTTAGDYTIHTLVAETTDNTDPNFLDLGAIVFGTTTGGDVLDIVTGAGLCAALDVTGAPITVDEELGIANNAFDSVSIYPNPIKNEVIIRNSRTIFIETVDLYDLSGRAIKHFSVKNNTSQLNFNLSELTSGMYIMILNSEFGQFERQIIKE